MTTTGIAFIGGAGLGPSIWKDLVPNIDLPHLLVAFPEKNGQDRLRGFIGVAAAIPKDGKSFISTLPGPKRVVMTAMLKIVGTRPPDSAIRAGLCHGLSEEQTNEIISDFTPEAKGLYTDGVTNRLDVSCHYIRTLRDKEFSQNQMTQMAGNLPEASSTDIDAGHLPMLEKPNDLAILIEKIMRSMSASSDT